MGLIDDCEQLFGVKSLYEVLSVEKNVSTAQLKKAYKKASLLCHPDKVGESKKDEATRKFQVLSKVHFILADEEKRSAYDEMGIVDDENTISMDDSSPDFWSNYFRTLFPRVTRLDIDNFMTKYKGSEEEKNDLIESYKKYEGDMDMISQVFIGYDIEEEERLCKILNKLIEKKEIPSFPKYVKETDKKKAARHKREKRMKDEADEVEEMAASDSLLNAMARRSVERQSQFNNLISSLEAKYAKKEPTGRKKRKP